MDAADEVKTLIAKIRSGEATEADEARLRELRQELLSIKEGAEGKRKFLRAPMKVALSFVSQEQLVNAYTFELGGGGVGVQLPGEYQTNDELDVQLTLPGESEPLQIRARVAWTAWTGDDAMVGLEFLNLDRQTQEHIETYVWEEVDLSDL